MASSSSLAAGDDSSLVHVAFNNKATHFVAATATGIRVFSCSSQLKHVFSKSGFAGGEAITSADVSHSGTLVAVVFGDSIRYWSELKRELMSDDMNPTCHGAVRGVRHAGNHVLVVTVDGRAALHTSRHRTVRANEFDTGPNRLGACALAQAGRSGQAFVLACPMPGRGQVQVRRARGRRVDVHAHSSSVACVALSRDGRMLATAGSKGTVLRIFSTNDGKKLQELRRGSDRADIHSLAFSPDSKWLAASSDKGTIHVFRVDVVLPSSSPEDDDGSDVPETAASSAPVNQSWSLSYLRGFIPVSSVPGYFQQDYSLAKFRLREGIKFMVAFSHEPHVVLIIGMDGSFYRCQFDPVNGGDMEKLEYRNFMKV